MRDTVVWGMAKNQLFGAMFINKKRNCDSGSGSNP